MAHYHIRVRDAGGSWASTQLPKVKSPTIKPPRAAPAKPPAVPKTPGPPKPPSPQRQTGAKPVPAVAGAASGIGQIGNVGARLARAGERGVNRVAGVGEEFNKDAGGAKMGHYHFNIPSRGSKLRDKRRMRDVDTGGGMSSTSGGMSSTMGGMSSTMGGMSSTSGMGIDSIGKPKKTQPYFNRSTPKSPFGRMRKPTGDVGTSEGAKKAAQTRRQGSTESKVRTGGNYGVDIKAGVNTRQVSKRPDPEPFRGYDKKSWW